MQVTSVAVNFHRQDWNEPSARATFEFSGKEVADLLLTQIKKTGIDVNNAYVDCPECGQNIGVDELKISLVVNFYG
jgi:hypothetical protein